MIGVPVLGETVGCTSFLQRRGASSPASHLASDHEPTEWPEWSNLHEAPAPRASIWEVVINGLEPSTTTGRTCICCTACGHEFDAGLEMMET